MSLIVEKKAYEIPNEGLHNAKILRVDDLGLVESTFGTKDRVSIVFQLEDKGKDGQPLEVRLFATKSLHEKSTLGKFLNSLKIKTNVASFDLNDIVGLKLQVVTVNKETDTGTYANISTVIPLKGKAVVQQETDEI